MSDIDPQKIKQEKTHSGRVLLQDHPPPKKKKKAKSRQEFDVVFMQPGLVKRADQSDSNWLIPASTLSASEALFDARPVYMDHPERLGGFFGGHKSPKVRDRIGVTFKPKWAEAEQEMQGGIRFYDDIPLAQLAITLFDQMLADKKAGLEVPPTGLSAVLFHKTEFDMENGIRISKEFTYIESVDVVYDAGAGGFVKSALSALGWEMPDRFQIATGQMPDKKHGGKKKMAKNKNDTLLDTRLDTIEAQIAALAPPTPPAPTAPPAPPAPPAPTVEERLDTLATSIEQLTTIVEQQVEGSTIEGMGQEILRPGPSSLEQVAIAAEALLAGVRPPKGVAPLGGIREFYHLLSGDWDFTGRFYDDRVYLANVDSSTMAKLTADALNKRVMIEFQVYPQWWNKIVTPEDFTSLQDAKWITLGGIGELPEVGEGAAYQPVTWDDIQQSDAFVKKGGYLGITLEAIDKDDTRRLQSAPRAIAQASWLTLSKSVSAIFTANSGVGPNINYDDSNTRALFHASNLNLGSSPFSWASWIATRKAMRQQTEHNSGERLGILTAPKFALVSSDNEMLALQTLGSANEPGTADNDTNPEAEGETREMRLARARDRVIVVDLWTDTDDWAAVADPQLYPSIGLGFRFGREPEIFSVASPTAGLMFTNDVMPIKARFFFAVGPIDWRGMYKHNV